MDDTKRLIGERIRRLRKEKGLSQEEVGAKADFHYTYIGGVERGEKNPSIEALQKIAEALDTELSELLPVPSEAKNDNPRKRFNEDMDKLSPNVQKAVVELIRLIAESRPLVGKPSQKKRSARER